MLNIGLISCGRSDFNIYLPLMEVLMSDIDINLKVIAAGTHSKKEYGSTINLFNKYNIPVTHTIDIPLLKDSPYALNTFSAETMIEFSKIWESDNFDLVFVLGDRYEMFAAASSTIPFNIPLAHLHGGETTLGAIDNVYREAITTMSTYHFTSSEEHQQRVIQLKNNNKDVYNVGSLALEHIKKLNVPISQTNNILFCFHPETVKLNNQNNINIICDTLNSIPNPITVTLPNNDTQNNIIRNTILKKLISPNRFTIKKALSPLEYYKELASCSFMLGNSSSGIIESSIFKKYSINLGDRQKGRACGKNVIHCSIDKDKIITAIDEVTNKGLFEGENIFYKPNTSNDIIKTIKSIWVP
tara:strand:- start:5238 stop:6308 length:1071 start_codon:yes stop_codon:yes gene_type:complete